MTKLPPNANDRQPDGTFADHSFIMDGRQLSGIDAKMLEARLRNDENDVRSRLLLLGFLDRNKNYSRQRFAGHLCWFIDNHPDHPALEHIGIDLTGAEHDLVKAHWLRQVRTYAHNNNVIRNAESFCSLQSPKTAERLLKNAIDMDPKNEEWYWLLSHLYKISAFSKVFGTPLNVAKKSLSAGTIAFELYDKKPSYGYLTVYYVMCAVNLAELAIEFGLYDSAASFGKRLVNLRKRTFRLPKGVKISGAKYSAAPHTGHAILGMIAIRQDDVELASKQLQKMSDYPMGSWFDFGLVSELLDRNRSEVVIEYLTKMLERCRTEIEQLQRDPPEVTSLKRQELLRKQQAEGRPAAPFIEYWLNSLRQEESYLQDTLSVARKSIGHRMKQ
jgi:hypothetical protein